MKVLHITAHLGGGVGKAHASLNAVAGSGIAHSYALLEAPKDTIYTDEIARSGGALHIEPTLAALSELVREADVVQLEWWNHPRLYGLLAATTLPPMRLATWLHISSLSAPYAPRAIVEMTDKTVFTTRCSLDAPNFRESIAARPDAFHVISSGFGFTGPQPSRPPPGAGLRSGFLGTVDFVKLHAGFFDYIDAVSHEIDVPIWGRHQQDGDVARRAAAMRHPGRVRFEGYTPDARTALSSLDLFVYLLAPGHYGTAENALVEAMSLGVVPIVYDNPPERTIVEHGHTGFIIRNPWEFAGVMSWAKDNPAEVRALGRAAAESVERQRSSAASSAAFGDIYRTLMQEPKRTRNFTRALGEDARTWFMSTVKWRETGLDQSPPFSQTPTKGSPDHFRACFPHDPSLRDIGAGASAA